MDNLTVQHYKKALTQSSELPLRKLKDRNFRLVYKEKKEPIRFFGNSSVVFKLTDGDRFYALKCYTTELSFRWEYLQRVQYMICSLRKDWIVPFEMYEKELTVENDEKVPFSCDVLLMPWIEGERLSDQVKFCSSRQSLREGLEDLLPSLIDLANRQIGQPFSHGDISPENIIVTPRGKMMLIDHDSFTFDGWKSIKGRAGWSFAYQHPHRDPRVPDLNADHFSFLVLAISLKAIGSNPGLFTQFNSWNGLLFTIDDFKYPGQSALLQEIKKIEDPGLQNLLDLLIDRLNRNSIAVPGLLDFLNDPLREPISQPHKPFSPEIKSNKVAPSSGIYLDADNAKNSVANTQPLIASKNLHNEEFFLEELNKEIMEKERQLKEARQQEELQKVGQQKREQENAELEREELLKGIHREDEIRLVEEQKAELEKILLPEKNSNHEKLMVSEMAKESTPLVEPNKKASYPYYQRQRKNIRASVFVALSSVIIILLGIKMLFPGTRIVEPVSYKKPGTSGMDFTESKQLENEQEVASGYLSETSETETMDSIKNKVPGTIPASGMNEKSFLLLPVSIGYDNEPGKAQNDQEAEEVKTPVEQKKQKIRFLSKKYKKNTVPFRKSGF